MVYETTFVNYVLANCFANLMALIFLNSDFMRSKIPLSLQNVWLYYV